MCDGGCGKFLWCDIPCVVTDSVPYSSCITFTIIGVFVVIVCVFGLYLRAITDKK